MRVPLFVFLSGLLQPLWRYEEGSSFLCLDSCLSVSGNEALLSLRAGWRASIREARKRNRGKIMLVYYYFNPSAPKRKENIDVLKDILRNHRIRISRISNANDPTEFKASFDDKVSDDYISGFRNQFSKIEKNFGYISFSEDPHSVLMWSHYANKHRGFALGLDVPESWLTKIVYSTEAPRVIPRRKGETNNYDIQYFADSIFRTKSISWAYEKEQRMNINFRQRLPKMCLIPDKKGNWYFVFPQEMLKAILIGCECPMTSEELLEMLPDGHLPNVAVNKMMVSRTGFNLELAKGVRSGK